MLERAFYDTVVFLLSLNQADPDHASCRSLLDVDSGTITWCITLSVITRAEATLDEYLDQLEQRSAMQGVDWREVQEDDIRAAMRRNRAVKERLERAGMQSRDIKQAFAAAWAQAVVLVTRDRDFFDPQDKGRRGRKKRGTAVSDLLREQLAIEPMFPAEALVRMRGEWSA